MKYWNETIEDNKNYEEVFKYIKSCPTKTFITRPEWDGIHFISKNNEYCILLKTGEILINELNVWDMDKGDWMKVNITQEAMELLKGTELI